MTRLPDPYATRAAGAGCSAERTADQLRGDTAQRWRRGAAGERQTAALLEPLRLAGWVVLHDRSAPGATANIDHLVCDGHTLWILDSKAWRGKVTLLGDGQLWYANGPAARRLDALRMLTTAVEATCRRRSGLRHLRQHAVAVIAGASIETQGRTDIELVAQAELVAYLSAGSAQVLLSPATEAVLSASFPAIR